MSDFVINALNGLTYAALLALVASWLALIFGFLHIVNFAHGAMFMLGAYIALTIQRETGSFALACAVAAVSIAVLAMLMRLLIFSRMKDGSPTDFILVTFGLMLVFENVVHMVWGTNTHDMPAPEPFSSSVAILGQTYPAYRLLLVAAAAFVALAGWYGLTRTRIGRQIRAVVEDRDMAVALGINSVKLMYLVLLVGGALAGLAGALAGPYMSVQPTMATSVLIDAFLVVAVAGLGNFLASFGGALLIGVAYTVGNIAMPRYSFAIVLTVAIGLLIWRPDGVFVRRKVARS